GAGFDLFGFYMANGTVVVLFAFDQVLHPGPWSTEESEMWGGGWPGTFQDINNGINYLRELSIKYKLDLRRIVVTGHSAGGHLALWSAARPKIESDSDIYSKNPLEISGVVSLAGITDLKTYLVRIAGSCGSSVDNLVGGLPEDQAERYSQASPFELLPLGVKQILVNGKQDNIVPISHIKPYQIKASASGDRIELREINNAGHFEVISPGSVAWPSIVDAIDKLSKNKIKKQKVRFKEVKN
ncbi:MAG: alpha/beta hydrolase, partial [Bacteroidota bacterium]